MDVTVSATALFLLSPLLLAISIALRISCGRPIFFRQWRTGWYGRQFQLLKFRTMAPGNEDGPLLTRAGDPRVTHFGKWLRRWKLDELPQFINILRGEMSLVGPRPDLENFWRQASPAARSALTLKPGLTGAASLAFRNEESTLTRVTPQQVGRFYVEKLLPLKAQLDLDYASRATILSDCRILLHTFIAALAIGSTPAIECQLDEQFSR